MRLAISESRNRDLKWEGLLVRNDFRERVTALRQKWTPNGPLSLPFSKKLQEPYSKKEFKEDVKKVIRDFSLNSKQNRAVSVYIVEGYSLIDDSYLNERGLILTVPKKKNELPTLIVGPDTLFEDFKQAWKYLGAITKLNKTRNKPRENPRRDFRVYEIGINGGDIDKINRQIKAEFKEDLDRIYTKKIFTEMCILLGVPPNKRPKLKL